MGDHSTLQQTLHWEASDRFRLARKLETLVATEADLVLAITSQVRDELVSRGVARAANQPDAELGGHRRIRPDAGAGSRCVKKLATAGDTTVVGYAGSLVPYEGLDDLAGADQNSSGRGPWT